MSREVHVPFYERLGVQFPRPTHRFCLSFRDAADLLAQHGLTVSDGRDPPVVPDLRGGLRPTFRRRRGPQGDTWHLDELFVTLNGRQQYLWRAVDEDGDVLDILVQSRRNRRAAARFFRKLLKRQRCVPRRLIHRQAPQLPGRLPHYDAIGGAPYGPVCEQPSRSLTSTNPAARAADARLQVTGTSLTLCRRAWRRAESLPRRSTSPTSDSPSPAPNAGICRMGDGDVCLLTEAEDQTCPGRRLPSSR